MKTEFEARILDIDVQAIKKKLSAIKAKFVCERKMRRYVYNIDQNDKNKWMRLRDNGEKTTLTIKEIQHDGIDGTKEIEITVDDFDNTNLLLNKLGFFHKAYQENKRTSYTLDGCEIEIDTWPKIPTYLEIEGKSEEDISRIAKLLGFKMTDTTSIGVEKVYQKYGLNINDFKELRF